MDSHVGLDYIVDNPDYCVKLASGKLFGVPDSVILRDRRAAYNAYNRVLTPLYLNDCSVGDGVPIREEASRGAAVGAVRLQSRRQAKSHQYSSHVSGDYF